MPHSHYVMDLFFLERVGSDKLRREVLRIDADSDEAAQAEALRVDGWRQTHHYGIRSIQTPARAADKLIYTSPVAEEPATDQPAAAQE